MGREPERVEMFNLSSSEGPKFAAIAREMVERTLKLGPAPTKVKERAPPGRPPNPKPPKAKIKKVERNWEQARGSGTGASPVDR